MNPLSFAIIRTIFRKELVDMLRDKRTLIAMIGIPIVLYPALFIFSSQAVWIQWTKVKKGVSHVAVSGVEGGPLIEWLREIPKVEITQSEDPERDLMAGEIDAVVLAEGDVEGLLEDGRAVSIIIQFDVTESASREAAKRLDEGLEKQRDSLLEKRLETVGITSEFVQPLRIERKNVAPPTKAAGTLLGSILPVIIVVMLGVGALYPAIDLTAGEKERGTFETLLSTPVSKMEMVSGKFLTVFCICMFTGLANLGSMFLTFAFMLSQPLAGEAELAFSLPPQAALLTFFVLVPLALFISAVMMSVAVFARTFKDAQNFMTPFFIGILFPTVVAAFPDTKLTAATQFIPITNVSLLFKELMIGQASGQEIFAVLLSTTVYALLSLVVAAWIFQREEVILSEEKGIPLTLRRAEFRARSAPTPGLALFLYGTTFLFMFYIAAFFQSRWLFEGILVTEWILILLPTVAILLYARVDLRKALSLHAAAPGAWLGSVLIGCAVVVLAIQIGLWQNKVFPMPEELAQELERIFQTEEMGVGLPWLLFVVALSPAVCEEALFRGALLSGFRRSLPPWATWLVVGALFGLFHMSVHRIFITGLLGIVLTYVVWRSNSLFPGVLAHFMINSVAVLVVNQRLPGPVQTYFDPAKIEQEGLAVSVVLIAVCVVVLGVGIIEWTARGRNTATYSKERG